MAGEMKKKVGQWAYDLFGSTGKAIDKRQKETCSRQGLKYDHSSGKCIGEKKSKD